MRQSQQVAGFVDQRKAASQTGGANVCCCESEDEGRCCEAKESERCQKTGIVLNDRRLEVGAAGEKLCEVIEVINEQTGEWTGGRIARDAVRVAVVCLYNPSRQGRVGHLHAELIEGPQSMQAGGDLRGVESCPAIHC